jgi:hypothetical protein
VLPVVVVQVAPLGVNALEVDVEVVLERRPLCLPCRPAFPCECPGVRVSVVVHVLSVSVVVPRQLDETVVRVCCASTDELACDVH